MAIFYRIANNETKQGLWYDTKGNFTGLIHTKFDFCLNNSLPMPYDSEVIGFLSACKTLDELFKWFPETDIEKLESFGYFITVYRAKKYKFYKNHWLIDQQTSLTVEELPLKHLNILYALDSIL